MYGAVDLRQPDNSTNRSSRLSEHEWQPTMHILRVSYKTLQTCLLILRRRLRRMMKVGEMVCQSGHSQRRHFPRF